MTLRQRAAGVLALLGLAAIMIGLPALLIALGADTLPRTLPTWDQVQTALLTPDDGTLALAALKGLGWVIWALLSLTILLEVVAQVSRIRVPSLPGLQLPQTTIHGVVATALALFVAVPGVTSSLPAEAVSSSGPHLSVTTPTALFDPAASAKESKVGGDRDAQLAESTTAYTVQPGDTLWSIAQRHLGEGNRYPLILELNAATLQHGPDWIHPGTILRLPTDTEVTQQSLAEDGVVVEKGDTLSALAQEHLDDAAQWPTIYRASHDIDQPGGRHLSDPDLIYPGWRLDIPNPRGERATEVAPPDETNSPHRGQARDAATEAADAVAALASITSTTALAGESADKGPATGSPHTPTEDSASGSPAGQEDTNTTAIAEMTDDPRWVLAGLVGGGALLGGGMLLALNNRRRAQFRNRRPGRAIATPDPGLAPVEMTVSTAGAAAMSLQAVDDVLRRLGGHCLATRRAVPVLAAVQLAERGLTLHLSSPTDLGAPGSGRKTTLIGRCRRTPHQKRSVQPSLTNQPRTRCLSQSVPATTVTCGS